MIIIFIDFHSYYYIQSKDADLIAYHLCLYHRSYQCLIIRLRPLFKSLIHSISTSSDAGDVSLVCLHLSPCSASLHLGRSPESRPPGPVELFHSCCCCLLREPGDVQRPSPALQPQCDLWPLLTTSRTRRASRSSARTTECRRGLRRGLMKLWWRWKREY